MTCKITIITAVFDALPKIKDTLQSISNQSLSCVEWIVVDGGSTDGTLQYLNDHRDKISKLIVGPDDGVYSAWNKALDCFNGEWVIFLGAGDTFPSSHTLRQSLRFLDGSFPQYKVVYGGVELIEQDSKKVLAEVGTPWPSLSRQWRFFLPGLPLHPEVFHHRSLFDNGLRFDLSYHFASDAHLLLTVACDSEFFYMPVIVTRMELGGQTGRLNNLRSISRETRRIADFFGYRPPLSHLAVQNIKLIIADIIALLIKDPYLVQVELYLRRLVYLIKSLKLRRW